MTVGPWKPIALEIYSTRISDIDIRSEVSEGLAVRLFAKIYTSTISVTKGKFILKSTSGATISEKGFTTGETGQAELTINYPSGSLDLWYPIGYGKQPLYIVEVQLASEVR